MSGAWAVVLLLQAAEPGQSKAPQPAVFAAQVETVVIDAFVNHKGAVIRGLGPADFVLKDNGVPQVFDLVPADSLPIRAVLVFDTSSSMRGAKLESLRGAAASFVGRLRENDEVALMAFSDEIALLAPLSTDHSEVRRALLSLQARGSTSVHDALFAALVVPNSSFRTLVILFSDGEDNTSWLGEKSLRSIVERSNALIHVVAAQAAPATPRVSSPISSSQFQYFGPQVTAYAKTLRALAETTGGSLIEVSSPERIEAAFAEIMDAMKSRYVLRYTPDIEPAMGWHTLDLQLKSREGKVRGRTGYWVEKR